MTETSGTGGGRARETAPLDRRSHEDRWFDRAERFLESYFVRVVLSCLIILSVLPLEEIVGVLGDRVHVPGSEQLDLFFFFVFAAEFAMRFAIMVRHGTERRTKGESALLLLDLIAVLSFLPLRRWVDLRYVRLIRLSRIVLLFGYWGDMVRDLWAIASSRARRFQIVFVLLSGLFLSFAGAVVLYWVAAPDLDEDGTRDSFVETLWWSFRQVQDPGNLVQEPRHAAVLLVSVFLTLAGLLLFSFLVGIGTSAIEELMQRSGRQPVGLRNHTVILGLGEHSHFLLDEFAEIYSKNRRVMRSAVLGPYETPFRDIAAHMDAFLYRLGDPVQSDDLDLVDVARSKRVVILGTDPIDPDAGVIATILATRDRNPDVDLYPDLEHESTLQAARTAGGPRTHVVGSGSFVGNYIAQNVANPGIYRLYRQLLTSAGCEIYSYVFDRDERHQMMRRAGAGGILDFETLHSRAYRDHAVTLLGVFVSPSDADEIEFEDLDVVMAPWDCGGPQYACVGGARLHAKAIRGVVAVALRWEDVKTLGRAIVDNPMHGVEAQEPDPEIGDVTLARTGGAVKRVLILGDSRRIPRVIADLIAFYGPLRVRVLVREFNRAAAIARDLVSALGRTLPDAEVRRSKLDDELRLALSIDGGEAQVSFQEADWSDATRLVHDERIGLDRSDMLMFLPRTRGAAALDGQVALDCLQLAQTETGGRKPPYPEHLRVLAMIQDPVKGDLLERRLDAMTGGADRERFTIVSSERVRHHFIVQNVFVRGLNVVFQHLFAPSGASIRRIEPRGPDGGDPTGSFDPWELARHLHRTTGAVFIGIEIDEGKDREPRTVLDPGEMPAGTRFEWSTIRAVYVLGDVDRPARTG